MIQIAQPLPCGNAVQLALYAHPSVAAWRVLRRADDAFAGPDDAAARLVYSGDSTGELGTVTDFEDLINGQPVHYRMYELIDGEWVHPDADAVVTPSYLAEPLYRSFDVAELVRERLALGLQSEVAAGQLRHPSGQVPVLTAYPQIEVVRFPVVTVILEDRRAEVRGVGEIMIPDQRKGTTWSAFEGWLDRSSVQIAVWSLNHEDRLQVRDAVQRILMLNLRVFEAAGLVTPDLSESDRADFESYNAPVYQSIFNFRCLHPSMVRASYSSLGVANHYEVIANETPARIAL